MFYSHEDVFWFARSVWHVVIADSLDDLGYFITKCAKTVDESAGFSWVAPEQWGQLCENCYDGPRAIKYESPRSVMLDARTVAYVTVGGQRRHAQAERGRAVCGVWVHPAASQAVARDWSACFHCRSVMPRETEWHLGATANSHEPYARSSAKGLGNESETVRGLTRRCKHVRPSRVASAVIVVGHDGSDNTANTRKGGQE